ncbi:DegQ family serine endoprotease [Agaribacterium haliotis]|uniref:DegQ family serine endoprotease n=1 Tax=Agaribacterium haliotis TaxID=2013869 RepID=UPI000BB54D0B|nr:DegQ family serine endoprotease [Agaribacterium haliotis]
MRKAIVALVLGLFASSAFAALPSHTGDGQSLPTLAPMLKQVNPAVVNIATYSTRKQAYNPLMNDPYFRHFFGEPRQPQQDNRPQRRQQSAGSGVIVDAKDGVVMTNYHVIKDADEIQVHLIDGRTYEAELAGSDPELDIAILKIDASKLTDVKLSDSDVLEVGDFVVAIGNPFGLGQTVTTGIVSALGRSGLGIEGYESFIQTDASINPGNSGGALVNLRGELVGINTAIISPAGGNVGIGFAIPVNMAKASMEQILESGEVKRGVIGVGIQDISADLQKAFDLKNGQQGVLITGVFDDTPAQKAGLEPGDIIIAVNGEATASTSQLRSQIGMRKIGDSVKVTVLRDGKEKTYKVKIGEPGESMSVSGKTNPLFEGAVLENANDGNGVVVVRLAPSSPMSYAGLRPGDVIYSVNRKSVASVEQLKQLVGSNDEQILLRIARNGRSFFVVLK